VSLQPDQSFIAVKDIIEFPVDVETADFSLRSGLAIKAVGAELHITQQSAQSHVIHYQLRRLSANKKVQLVYQGKIHGDQGEDQFGMPELVYNSQGVYLDSQSAWFPRFRNFQQFSFELKTNVPAGWEIISQGKRRDEGDSIRYSMPHPQDDIYLLGGAYQRYFRQHDGIELEIYLLAENPGLAQKYLENSATYIADYSELIGPYPYRKFAVIENRWQTGYGMPSFTLLGSRVIRLPFILYTSLPHEILHNWWGNGVFVDYRNGNWSEGLTAYMADHQNSEKQHNDDEYRRKALQRYANFAARQRDFALVDFTSRHSDASQAVGYSKSMMLFHMLRHQLGNKLFDANIRQFWQQYQFKTASFNDLVRHLTSNSDIEPEAFIRQWLVRTGAPEISLASAQVSQQGKDYVLDLKIDQLQDAAAYSLKLPVEVSLQGAEQPVRQWLELENKSQNYKLVYKTLPVSVKLDPDYDVFRLLHPEERPASLGRLFGAGQQVLVLPADAPQTQLDAWKKLAAAWGRRYDNISIVNDREFAALPAGTAVWILGWENRLLEQYRARLTSPSQKLSSSDAMINNQVFSRSDDAVVMLDNEAARSPLGFIGADNPFTIEQLAGKLPHYNSYGLLVFSRDTVKNRLKLHLKPSSSPMHRQLLNVETGND